jgi:hypothetical protein
LIGLVDATSQAQLPHITKKGAGLLGLPGYPYVADSYYPQIQLGQAVKVPLGAKDIARIVKLTARTAERVEQQKERKQSLRSGTKPKPVKMKNTNKNRKKKI